MAKVSGPRPSGRGRRPGEADPVPERLDLEPGGGVRRAPVQPGHAPRAGRRRSPGSCGRAPAPPADRPARACGARAASSSACRRPATTPSRLLDLGLGRVDQLPPGLDGPPRRHQLLARDGQLAGHPAHTRCPASCCRILAIPLRAPTWWGAYSGPAPGGLGPRPVVRTETHAGPRRNGATRGSRSARGNPQAHFGSSTQCDRRQTGHSHFSEAPQCRHRAGPDPPHHRAELGHSRAVAASEAAGRRHWPMGDGHPARPAARRRGQAAGRHRSPVADHAQLAASPAEQPVGPLGADPQSGGLLDQRRRAFPGRAGSGPGGRTRSRRRTSPRPRAPASGRTAPGPWPR